MYTLAAAGAALIVFAGFARSFYLKGMFDTPPLSALLFMHGVVMTLWFTLFAVQVGLVATGHTRLHRRLGAFGALLFVLVVVVCAAAAIDGARRGARPAPDITPLMFLAIPLVDLLVFTILVGSALWLRRQADVHRRLMLLATLSILTPGIARLPIDALQRGGLPAFFGLTLLFVLVCVGVDTLRNRRLHPAFGWGCALVVLSVPARIALAGTAAWDSVARWLIA